MTNNPNILFMKKSELYRYFTVSTINGQSQVELANLHEFFRYVQAHQCKTIFLIKDNKEQVTHFIISHEGLLVRQASEGFATLEDYKQAQDFPDAASFYEAQNIGCNSFADYQLVKEAGIKNADVVEKIRAAGYIDGFEEWKTATAWHQLMPNDDIRNAYDFYKMGISNGFDEFKLLREALERGFSKSGEYALAKEKGYTDAAAFYAGQNGGFKNAVEWKEAKEAGITTRAELEKFRELQLLGPAELKHDERVMIVLLSKLPEKKKVSRNKLMELYRQEAASYITNGEEALPTWFTTGFTDDSKIVSFLQSDAVKAYGLYDEDGEFFETSFLQKRKVIIDGSNVAFNSGGNAKAKPYVSNIIKLVNALKQLQFTDITVVCDASLRHHVEDGNLLPELRQGVTYMEAPAEYPADIFLIQYIKKERCLLISNDTFRDWKQQDKWVAQHIDFYRLAFMIKGETVLLPHFSQS